MLVLDQGFLTPPGRTHCRLVLRVALSAVIRATESVIRHYIIAGFYCGLLSSPVRCTKMNRNCGSGIIPGDAMPRFKAVLSDTQSKGGNKPVI